MSTLDQAPELKNKITISWALFIGLIVGAIAITFFVTTFYLTTSTIEQRMDKRHQRHEDRIKEIEKLLKELKPGAKMIEWHINTTKKGINYGKG